MYSYMYVICIGMYIVLYTCRFIGAPTGIGAPTVVPDSIQRRNIQVLTVPYATAATSLCTCTYGLLDILHVYHI